LKKYKDKDYKNKRERDVYTSSVLVSMH